jgi:excinuclease ABC subunit C
MLNNLKDFLNKLPHLPGVYLMKSNNDQVIYVGKAKDLKNRISSYFSKSLNDKKTSVLVKNIHKIDFITTKNEVEALILEDTFIKKYQPKYNILLKDDKRYPFLKITINEDYPRILIVRKRDKDNSLYFGPYTSAKSMRETLKLINRIFPIRKCNKNLKLTNSQPPYFKPVGQYCLYYQLNQCLAPCQGNVDPNEYKKIIDEIILFLKGKTDSLIKSLNTLMQNYSKNYEFEKAARIRDRILHIKNIMEKQSIVSSQFESQDFIAFTKKDDIYNITILFIREGKVIGKNNFFVKKKFSEMSEEEILSSFIKQYYSNPSFLPSEIITDLMLEDSKAIEEWLYTLTNQKIKIRTCETDFENRVIELARQNSIIELSNYLADIETKDAQKRLKDLMKVLKLKNVPKSIEAFDVSNIMGKFAVGSMVKFVNGLPAKNEYRKFNIKTVDGIDDFKMIEEIVYRRYKRLKEENKELPDLILIDGGKGQLQSAIKALEKNEIFNIPIISLAKKEEVIYLPNKEEPLKLNRNSPALKLLQNIRDEAHRFAITFHKEKRSKEIYSSILDEIEGIGETIKNRLLKYFGSLDEILNASEDELLKIPGITKKIIEKIKELKEKKLQ